VVWALWLAASTHAQTIDVFEVKGVAVDVTDESAAAARDKALVLGEGLAFRRMLERLTLRADHEHLPDLPSSEIAAYVRDFSIEIEKRSAVRYLASLIYRFKPAEVRRLLTDYGLWFAETPSKPVLVLPVYQTAGALLLWDEPNPWRDAWNQGVAQDGLVPLVHPIGDLSDIAAVGGEQALDGDVQRLAAIARRYEAGDVLVVHGTRGMDARGQRPKLDVVATRYGTAINEQSLVKSFSVEPGEDVDALLRRAASALVHDIEDNWKRDNILRLGDLGVLAVAVPISGLSHWLEIRERLDGVAVIRRIDLVLMSLDEVRVNLHHFGSPDQLVLALEQADLLLTWKGDESILELLGPAGHDRS
jgi:hypothetical protein